MHPELVPGAQPPEEVGRGAEAVLGDTGEQHDVNLLTKFVLTLRQQMGWPNSCSFYSGEELSSRPFIASIRILLLKKTEFVLKIAFGYFFFRSSNDEIFMLK